MPSIVAGRCSGRHGIFSPDSVTWMVNREAVLLLGGGRALLMQLAHPAVAAAVDEHSEFHENPLRRLRRTLGLSFQLAFGTRAEAEAAARQINSRHRTVRGEGYSALDPDLLLWVHATLIDSSLETYSRFVRPLTLAERAAYQRESWVTARLVGIPRERFPSGPNAFDGYIRSMLAGGLKVDGRARRLASQVLAPPAVWIPRTATFPLAAITAGLLPADLRRAYGMPWRRREQATFAASCRLVRRLLPMTPALLREVPAARRA